ncbi:MAG: elongation factor Ts [Oscillospiraceae bacterium]|nr:elongation factor Ts [Oscillospiraceae bacterium]
MGFTANDVKTLREMTGVGMMDCKKALAASDGDMDGAVAFLREKGLAAAQKKAGRIAAEGMAYAAVYDDVGVVVEVNAETDFVAKNDLFVEFVKNVAGVIAKFAPVDLAALMFLPYPGTGRTIEQEQQDKVLVIGENIKIRRFARYDSNMSVAYNHMNGRIGVLVNLKVSDNLKDNEEVVVLGKDIAMQIAAMRPSFRDKSDVDEATLAREKEILLAQAHEENKNAAKPKPDAIIEKMVMGRVGKYYEENCLLQQIFVKDNKVSVEQHVAAVAKELGGTVEVLDFVRFEKGEGIEKKQEDFAAEIASMVK